jgi:hypothetical protein
MFERVLNSVSSNQTLTLPERMKYQLEKYNSWRAHSFRGFVVILKSKPLLNEFTKHMKNSDKLFDLHQKMVSVCSDLYSLYDPRLIYTFNDEIHLVFMYNDYGHQPFEGNIHKMLSHMSSSATYSVTKEMLLDVNPEFTNKFVQFKQDYDILNFIKWKQSHCLTRVRSLYDSLEELPDWKKYGTFLKKKIVLKTNPSTHESATDFDFTYVDTMDLIVRRKLTSLHVNLFDETFDFKFDFDRLICHRFIYENEEMMKYLSSVLNDF